MATDPSTVFFPGPALSISTGAPIFRVGECILVDGLLDVDTETPASDLPPAANGSSPQHFAFIRSVQVTASGLLVEVFPIVSFSRMGGALEGYDQLPDSTKESLIPLPALSHQHPTPALFGDPLTIGGCSTPLPSFLHLAPCTFVIPGNQSFKMTTPPVSLSPAQLVRIEEYRRTLRVIKEGGDNTTGKASSIDAAQAWANVVSGGIGNVKVVVREDIADIMTPDGYLIAEDVDEDADGDDCTWRDQLFLAASSDPAWISELQKYLREEREEKEKLQEERKGRLTSWLGGQDIPPALTA